MNLYITSIYTDPLPSEAQRIVELLDLIDLANSSSCLLPSEDPNDIFILNSASPGRLSSSSESNELYENVLKAHGIEPSSIKKAYILAHQLDFRVRFNGDEFDWKSDELVTKSKVPIYLPFLPNWKIKTFSHTIGNKGFVLVDKIIQEQKFTKRLRSEFIRHFTPF